VQFIKNRSTQVEMAPGRFRLLTRAALLFLIVAWAIPLADARGSVKKRSDENRYLSCREHLGFDPRVRFLNPCT